MEPTASEFLRLTEFSGCPASRNNADISKLLYLIENGFKRDLVADPAFGYRNVFQEYVTRIDNCINGQSSGLNLADVLDEMRWKAENILQTEFDVRGHRTLERALNDKSVPFLIGGTDAGQAMRQALLEGKWIYSSKISESMPGLHFLHADKKCNRVMAYSKPPAGKAVYQEKNGRIIPYTAALKKETKTKKIIPLNYKIMKQPEQAYTAIETADGFYSSPIRRKGRQICRNSCSLWRIITSIPISTSVPSMFTGRKASSDRGRLSIRAGTCSLNILT